MAGIKQNATEALRKEAALIEERIKKYTDQQYYLLEVFRERLSSEEQTLMRWVCMIFWIICLVIRCLIFPGPFMITSHKRQTKTTRTATNFWGRTMRWFLRFRIRFPRDHLVSPCQWVSFFRSNRICFLCVDWKLFQYNLSALSPKKQKKATKSTFEFDDLMFPFDGIDDRQSDIEDLPDEETDTEGNSTLYWLFQFALFLLRLVLQEILHFSWFMYLVLG